MCDSNFTMSDAKNGSSFIQLACWTSALHVINQIKRLMIYAIESSHILSA